jgi:hypothetical protein
MLEINTELHNFAGLHAGYSLDKAVGCILNSNGSIISCPNPRHRVEQPVSDTEVIMRFYADGRTDRWRWSISAP